MTAWVLTWLCQGTALVGLMALLLRCAPRVSATTRPLIWCGILVGLVWLGLPNCGLTPIPVRGSDPIGTAFSEPGFYVPSAPNFLVAIAVGIWAAIALVKLVRLIPALHAMYAVRDPNGFRPLTLGKLDEAYKKK